MSFITKRPGTRFYWYYWRDEEGKQQAKSLETEDKIIAEIKKGEEDKLRHFRSNNLPYTDARWGTVKSRFLAGYPDDSETKIAHIRSLSLFESFAEYPKPSEVTYQTAKGFRDWLIKKTSRFGTPYKPNTVNNQIRNLHAFFNEAKKAGFSSSNPFDGVDLLPYTKRTPKYIRKDQVRAAVREARRSWSADKVLMLNFFLYTGVRLGEMVNLKWASIDMERKVFHLHGSEIWEPKDREENTIPLHKVIYNGLKKHKKTSEYLFPGKKGRRCKYSVGRLFNRLYKRAGITDRSGVHVLRHTFFTHAPLSPKAKQKVAGHADISTTMRYDHVTPEDMKAVKKVAY